MARMVNMIAEFRPDEIAEAIKGFFNLPTDAEVEFILEEFMADQRDTPRKIFGKAKVKFKQEM